MNNADQISMAYAPFTKEYAVEASITVNSSTAATIKAPKLLLLAFILVSFSTNTLNFIWHGLNYPDSLPARQSYLYILLLLIICYEAFLYLQEYSRAELAAVFAGVLFFLLLSEKLSDDDAITGTCFLVTGIYLALYALLIYYRRNCGTLTTLFCVCTVFITITESGMNTYLTSVPTVSRTTYLSNYDSYQTLTNRTVENENNDFFRFEKFARRTQNDAMLIGFQGGSYFSSTLNSLVSDFYEKYGMKGSRVNYCYDGATPVTAALLANRYMLYTLDRGYDNLFTLVDTEGKLYLYKNNYSLPLGYVVTSSEARFDTAQNVTENIHEEDTDEKNLNPIQRQINLVHRLGIEEDIFSEVSIGSYGSQADLYIEEDGHYYAYTSNTKIDTIKMQYEEESKSFSQIKKKYILDLGYHNAGETLSFKSENGKDLNLTAYKINESVLSAFVSQLNHQTMTVDSYDETSLNGHIDITTPGNLVLSIPYDPGWTLYVNGEKTDINLFEETFISIALDTGSHTIALRYFPKGLIPGMTVSILSLLFLATLYYITRKRVKSACHKSASNT